MARFTTSADGHYVTPRMQQWRRRTSGPLTVLAIGSLPLIALDFIRADLTSADRAFIDVIDVLVFVAFGIDFVVQLSLTPKRAAFIRGEWLELVLVVSQGLAMVPALTHFGWLRVLRVTHLSPVLASFTQLAATGGLASRSGRLFLRRHSTRFALSVAGITWIGAAVAFTIAEDVHGSGVDQSFGDGMWWALCTITTVGYGDIVPESPVSRLVGGIAMVIGIAAFAVVTASAAEFLLRHDDGLETDLATGVAAHLTADGVDGANGDQAVAVSALATEPGSGRL